MFLLIGGVALASVAGIWGLRDQFDDIASIARWVTIGGVVYVVVTKTDALKYLNKKVF